MFLYYGEDYIWSLGKEHYEEQQLSVNNTSFCHLNLINMGKTKDKIRLTGDQIQSHHEPVLLKAAFVKL